ncbi:MAG: ATPase [Flavobacteriaceae bacterium]|nr:ATPase [Flavobacteriaceae bacterium]
MIFPEDPTNEAERLVAVRKYRPEHTVPDENLDNITSLISLLCDVPIALITLLNQEDNIFKSHHGIPFNKAPRKTSFCGHAILEEDDLFIVEDAREDIRFKDNPLVLENKAIFYAGAPLINKDGYRLGMLCIFDHKPRNLTYLQRQSLLKLAKEAVNLLEMHHKNWQLEEIQHELKERNERLRQFANVVSHDLKSPLANITGLIDLIKDNNGPQLTRASLQYLDYMEEASHTLRSYIDGILRFYKADELLKEDSQHIQLNEFLAEILDLLRYDEVTFELPDKNANLHANKAALAQILINLIDNSVKYNNKEQPTLKITFNETPQFYEFSVIDNGMGIDRNIQDDVFTLFKTTGVKDKFGKSGTGIGLATVKSLVTKLRGTIALESELDKGSAFSFTIKK